MNNTILWDESEEIGDSFCWEDAAWELGYNLLHIDPKRIIDGIKRCNPKFIVLNDDYKLVKDVNIPIVRFKDLPLCSNYEIVEKHPSMVCEIAFYKPTNPVIEAAKELSKFHNIRCYFNGPETYNVGYLSREARGVAYSSAGMSIVEKKDCYLALDISKAGGNPYLLDGTIKFNPMLFTNNNLLITYKKALEELINANTSSK